MLVAVGLAGAVAGAAVMVWADAHAAKRHTALLDNIERYQALQGSNHVSNVKS